MRALRVLTLNLWGRLGPWEARVAETRAWLDALDPDVVLLQEVMKLPAGTTSAEEVATPALAHVAFFGAPANRFYEEEPGTEAGVAVLSRWPIDAWHGLVLPDGGGLARPNAAIHVRTNGLDVVNAHLAAAPAFGAIRQLQVRALDGAVRKHADPAALMPPILGGDFNADPDSDEVRWFSGLCELGGVSTYWIDAMRNAGPDARAWTLDAANPHLNELNVGNRRVDHLFVGDVFAKPGGGGRVLRCDLACHQSLTGTLASDHYGLVADIVWAAPPTG